MRLLLFLQLLALSIPAQSRQNSIKGIIILQPSSVQIHQNLGKAKDSIFKNYKQTVLTRYLDSTGKWPVSECPVPETEYRMPEKLKSFFSNAGELEQKGIEGYYIELCKTALNDKMQHKMTGINVVEMNPPSNDYYLPDLAVLHNADHVLNFQELKLLRKGRRYAFKVVTTMYQHETRKARSFTIQVKTKGGLGEMSAPELDALFKTTAEEWAAKLSQRIMER